MWYAGTVDYKNCMADFNVAYPSLGTPGTNSFGFTSSNSSAGNLQHFKDTYAVGYQYGYDIQSEHFVADTVTSIYCTYAGIIGRSGGYIFHPIVMAHVTDQENINGWQLGNQMVFGSRVDILGLDIELANGGTFARSSNMTETNAGYTSGIINCTMVKANTGVINAAPLFSSGGQNFQVNNSSKIYYTGLIYSTAASAATTGTTKQTLATFSVSAGPQGNDGSIFMKNTGAVLRIKAWGITASNSNNKVVEIDFGGTAVASITSTASGGVVELEADIIVSWR